MGTLIRHRKSRNSDLPAAPHNKRRIPASQPAQAASEAAAEALPGISLDGLKVWFGAHHEKLISGRPPKNSPPPRSQFFSAPYRWLDLPEGKAAIRSFGFDHTMLRCNPGQLLHGHNLFCFDEDPTLALREVIYRIWPLVPELDLSRWDCLLLRGGHVELSEIDLAADFFFPNPMAMHAAIARLQRFWRWPWNRQKDVALSGSFRFRHKGWTLKGYDKGEQIIATQRAPKRWMLDATRCRYRIEVRICRPDIHLLARRIGLPHLDLTRLGDWTPDLYPLVFDLYARRLAPRRRKGSDEPSAADLFELLKKAGARPAWRRTA